MLSIQLSTITNGNIRGGINSTPSPSATQLHPYKITPALLSVVWFSATFSSAPLDTYLVAEDSKADYLRGSSPLKLKILWGDSLGGVVTHYSTYNQPYPSYISLFLWTSSTLKEYYYYSYLCPSDATPYFHVHICSFCLHHIYPNPRQKIGISRWVLL